MPRWGNREREQTNSPPLLACFAGRSSSSLKTQPCDSCGGSGIFLDLSGSPPAEVMHRECGGTGQTNHEEDPEATALGHTAEAGERLGDPSCVRQARYDH